MLTANKRMSGRMSSANCCTASAPWSRMRRRIVIMTPAITRKEAQTKPWKITAARIPPIRKLNVGKPKM